MKNIQNKISNIFLCISIKCSSDTKLLCQIPMKVSKCLLPVSEPVSWWTRNEPFAVWHHSVGRALRSAFMH